MRAQRRLGHPSLTAIRAAVDEPLPNNARRREGQPMAAGTGHLDDATDQGAETRRDTACLCASLETHTSVRCSQVVGCAAG
jgi:hypothetical protein